MEIAQLICSIVTLLTLMLVAVLLLARIVQAELHKRAGDALMAKMQQERTSLLAQAARRPAPTPQVISPGQPAAG